MVNEVEIDEVEIKNLPLFYPTKWQWNDRSPPLHLCVTRFLERGKYDIVQRIIDMVTRK